VNIIKNPIANRRLTCLLDGKLQRAQVILGQPYEEDSSFVCEYEIAVGETVNAHKIAGTDGIQAIQLALFMVGSTLSSFPGATEWKWNDDAYTGFPASLEEPVLGFIP
jgi:hypothetical protein